MNVKIGPFAKLRTQNQDFSLKNAKSQSKTRFRTSFPDKVNCIWAITPFQFTKGSCYQTNPEQCLHNGSLQQTHRFASLHQIYIRLDTECRPRSHDTVFISYQITGYPRALKQTLFAILLFLKTDRYLLLAARSFKPFSCRLQSPVRYEMKLLSCKRGQTVVSIFQKILKKMLSMIKTLSIADVSSLPNSC